MTGAPRQHYGVTLAVLATAALSYALLQTMVAPALLIPRPARSRRPVAEAARAAAR
jgi:hypothetical protein